MEERPPTASWQGIEKPRRTLARGCAIHLYKTMRVTEVQHGEQLAKRQNRSEQHAALFKRSRERRAGAGHRGRARAIGTGKFHKGDHADVGAPGLRGGGAES